MARLRDNPPRRDRVRITVKVHNTEYLLDVATRIGAFDKNGNPDLSEANNFIIHQHRYTGGCLSAVPASLSQGMASQNLQLQISNEELSDSLADIFA